MKIFSGKLFPYYNGYLIYIIPEKRLMEGVDDQPTVFYSIEDALDYLRSYAMALDMDADWVEENFAIYEVGIIREVDYEI